jgi:hypothetical protein
MRPWRKQAPPPTRWQQFSSYVPPRWRPARAADKGGSGGLAQRLIQMIGLATLADKRSPSDSDSAVVRLTGMSVQLLALRRTARDIGELKPLWPILLPLLAWVGYRAYQDERARVRGRR